MSTTITQGICGTNLAWVLTNDGTLTINGSGAMMDYSYPSNNAPWFSNRSTIKKLKLGSNITSIGFIAFNDCINLGTIVCEATTPPTLSGSTSFAGVPNTVKLFVPVDAVTAYKNSNWNYVSNNIGGIIVFVPVTNITGVPATVNMGKQITLTATVQPSNADCQTIMWSLVNAGTAIASVDENMFFAAAEGIALVKATIKDGKAEGVDYTQYFVITASPGKVADAITKKI